MSLRTTLQLIAAAITIALVVMIHSAAGALFNFMSVDFALGFLFCGVLVTVVYEINSRMDKSAANAANRREQQGARYTIDL